MGQQELYSRVPNSECAPSPVFQDWPGGLLLLPQEKARQTSSSGQVLIFSEPIASVEDQMRQWMRDISEIQASGPDGWMVYLYCE